MAEENTLLSGVYGDESRIEGQEEPNIVEAIDSPEPPQLTHEIYQRYVRLCR